MRIDVNIDGMSQLTRQLAALAKDADKAIASVINQTITETRNEAVQGIQSGPASGRVYRRGGITHQASAPGQYPMSDTGRLAASVAMQPATPSNLRGQVGTNLVYGRYLEFGTSRMAPRPWLLPSFEKARVKVEDRMRAEIARRT
jgi:HK97 gp10 family phage protein